jgi:uncharacterized protein
MKRNILIFHGTAGSPEGNWFPWLKGKLEKDGQTVFVPRFPTPEGESLAAWFQVLEKYTQYINKEAILVGHSKGGLFTLRLLERLQVPVHATFLVAPPIGVQPIHYYKEDALFSKGFEFDWGKIRANAGVATVYHSDNDPYVCLENGKELAKQLGVDLTYIPNAGHLNAESGYTSFEKLLSDINKVL